MSIYATLWELKFPLFGQSHTGCEWEHVIAQGVPEHIGEDGDADYLSFLPPRAESIAGDLRAVVIVRKLQPKGTERSAQEYPNPLLVLTGREYETLPFSKLHEAISDALRGSRPPVIAEFREPSGKVTVLYEDGSRQIVRGDSDA
jgi:hypothetical protein